MTTAEKTIQMFEALPKREQRKVFPVIQSLLEKRVNEKDFFKPISKRTFLKQAKISLKEVKGGDYFTEQELLARIRQKHGL